jgi:uracil phosphoribosyltransferase
MTTERIETPLATMKAPVLANDAALITTLRAGNGLLDGFLQLMPTAKIGHIGLYRENGANSIVEYYFKVPLDMATRETIVLDPMLATGQSAIAAVNRLKEIGTNSLQFVCLLASPEGLEYFHEFHPDVTIYTAAIDEKLNKQKYIVPGLGDADDRLFGTQ